MRLPDLPARRRAATQELAEAFCAAPDFILGTRIKPLTPATFSMLVATDNAFVVGGPVRECDIRNFIWFHHRLYGNCTAFAWRLRKWLALDRLTTVFAQPVHRWLGIRRADHYSLCMAMAADQIEVLVEQTFSLFPAVGGANSHAPIACLEAHLVHRFAATYGWPPERTRHMPLRQLFQLERLRLAAAGEKIVDPGEEDLLFRHLAARNAALAPHRKEARRHV